MCSGSNKSTVGGSVVLECEVKFRGSMPTVQWYNSDGEMIKSEDRTEIRLMKKALHLRDLTAESDKQNYMCKLSIGDFMEACSMTLDVECEYSSLVLRSVHVELSRYGSRYVDRQNATHSTRNSVRQKDQRCRPSMLRQWSRSHSVWTGLYHHPFGTFALKVNLQPVRRRRQTGNFQMGSPSIFETSRQR